MIPAIRVPERGETPLSEEEIAIGVKAGYFRVDEDLDLHPPVRRRIPPGIWQYMPAAYRFTVPASPFAGLGGLQ